MVQRMAKLGGISVEDTRAKVTETIAAKRFGRPEEFGDCCAYLCSMQAGFISGQNIQLDGASYVTRRLDRDDLSSNRHRAL